MVRKGAPPALRPVFDAAHEVQEFLWKSGAEFCFIGGLAVQRWGQPRLTVDVDLTLLCPIGDEARAVDRLLGRFPARRSDARKFALANRVVLLRTSGGIALDVSLGVLDFENRCVGRATDFNFGPRLRLRTCSAEDLIVHKAFADRGQDWVDIEYVIVRQLKRLDWRQIERELQPLLELSGAVENLATLRKLKEKAERGA
jgi:hypothetical protein